MTIVCVGIPECDCGNEGSVHRKDIIIDPDDNRPTSLQMARYSSGKKGCTAVRYVENIHF